MKNRISLLYFRFIYGTELSGQGITGKKIAEKLYLKNLIKLFKYDENKKKFFVTSDSQQADHFSFKQKLTKDEVHKILTEGKL
jgi:hypothetical protein